MVTKRVAYAVACAGGGSVGETAGADPGDGAVGTGLGAVTGEEESGREDGRTGAAVGGGEGVAEGEVEGRCDDVATAGKSAAGAARVNGMIGIRTWALGCRVRWV